VLLGAMGLLVKPVLVLTAFARKKNLELING
jgi:hypothetical protein